MSFASLGLSAPILDAVQAQGYDTPSPIQLQAIPAVLTGQDIMAAAQTGTGKTAGFTLPILEKLSQGSKARGNHVRALILTPTRELAAQVAESVKFYGQNLNLSSNVVFGGVKINPQMHKLAKGCDILVATPGRLMDLYQQNAVKFGQLEILVLDEADRMLDMGFIRDIKKIIALLPKNRQNLLFSATFSNDIRALAKGLVRDPVEISVSPRNKTADTVSQKIYPVDKNKKPALLTQLIKDNAWKQTLVFTKTKHGANRLTRHLESKGIPAAAIHGNKSQAARTKALAQFKNNDVKVLVATDIAARGIDIDQLPHVVNFELPNVPEDYVHRIGRTGRAGSTGEAVSLVCADETKLLKAIERLTKQVIEREVVKGFEVVHNIEESKLDTRPVKPKKPKKPRVNNQNSANQNASNGHNKNTNNKQASPGNNTTKATTPKRKPTRSRKPVSSFSKPV
ncbi:DEAD/DEAH box helicase [Algibacillus agarilyticus]|uniref:DEAD/DEAH box helicase n=1 Tax=Algibacillus agarilyticus TaxID=2234133 RepID=UPI000DD02D8E|nr:DEAD/DEAH box helicase [Algibacillus agarilyticus]